MNRGRPHGRHACRPDPARRTAADAVVVRAADRPFGWLLRDYFKPLLTGATTGGRLFAGHVKIYPGKGPPPHCHTVDGEGFDVLRGQVTLLAGDRLVAADPGAFVWGPPDVTHCFKGTAAGPTEFVLLSAPASFGDVAAARSTPAGDVADVPPLSPAVIGKLLAIEPGFDIAMMPPGHPVPTTAPVAVPVPPVLTVDGKQVRPLATAASTGGGLTAAAEVLTTATGSAPHAHAADDEVLYVLDGTHTVDFDSRTETATPGDLVYIPAGVRHAVAGRGRLLRVHQPA